MATWFTTDLHLGHSNIIDYCGRPFANVDAMSRALIDTFADDAPDPEPPQRPCRDDMSWNSNSEPMTNVSSKSVINPDANAEEAHEIDCGR